MVWQEETVVKKTEEEIKENGCDLIERSFYGRKEMKELGKKVELNIKATMDERWVNDFCSMLNWMQRCGELGHSSVVAFYSDGDGDFRPKFEFDRDYDKTDGYWAKDGKSLPEIEVIYDAG